MNADIKGCLNQIDRSWKCFEHNGLPMTKAQVIAVLTYEDSKGIETVNEIPDSDIELVLNQLKSK